MALKQAQTSEFRQYQQQVVRNVQTLVQEFKSLGYTLVTGGSDNHMVLLDLKPEKLDGARVEAVCEQMNITLNKNTCPGDKSAMTPCGIRIGAPAMTSRGAGEEDFRRVARFINASIKLCKKIQAELPKERNKLKDFKDRVASGEVPEINQTKEEISKWASSFPLPVSGVDA